MLVFLLPYIEQNNVYNALQTDKNVNNFDASGVSYQPAGSGVTGGWWNNNNDYNIAQVTIKTFICPSADVGKIGSAIGVEDDEENSGSTVEVYTWGPGFGVSNYAGVGGARGTGWNGSSFDPVYSQFAGIYTNRSKTRVLQIQDGTSNTLAFGENLGDCRGSNYNIQDTWIGWGFGFTKYGLRGPAGIAWDGVSGANYPQAIWSGFSSNHTGATQFAFADGHVASLTNSGTNFDSTPFGSLPNTMGANWLFLQQLGGMADGAVVPSGVFGGY